MKQLDMSEQKVLECVPSVIRFTAERLAGMQTAELSEVEQIRKRLVTDDRMEEVWKAFEHLSKRQQNSRAKFFFKKFPLLMVKGKKQVQTSQSEISLNLQRALKTNRKMMIAFRALSASAEQMMALFEIENSLEASLEVCYSGEYDFCQEFGADYIKAFQFRKKLSPKAFEFFAVRCIFLLLKECGIQRSLSSLVTTLVTAATNENDRDDIDEEGVVKMISELKKSEPSFRKIRKRDARFEFDEMVEDLQKRIV